MHQINTREKKKEPKQWEAIENIEILVAYYRVFKDKFNCW